MVYFEAVGDLTRTFPEPRWDGVWAHHAERLAHTGHPLVDAPAAEIALAALCLYGFVRDRRAHGERNAGCVFWLEAAREIVDSYRPSRTRRRGYFITSDGVENLEVAA